MPSASRGYQLLRRVQRSSEVSVGLAEFNLLFLALPEMEMFEETLNTFSASLRGSEQGRSTSALLQTGSIRADVHDEAARMQNTGFRPV